MEGPSSLPPQPQSFPIRPLSAPCTEGPAFPCPPPFPISPPPPPLPPPRPAQRPGQGQRAPCPYCARPRPCKRGGGRGGWLQNQPEGERVQEGVVLPPLYVQGKQ